MDFALNEDQVAIQDAARAFAEGQLAPHSADWDENKHFPVDVLRQAAELGFAGIYVNEDVGGSGLSRLDASIIFEALSYGDVPVAAYLTIHNMASWMIDRFGSDDLRQRYLPRLTTMHGRATALQRVDQDFGRPVHIGEQRWVGEQGLERRAQIMLGVLQGDAARHQRLRQGLDQAMTLLNFANHGEIGRPLAPGAAAQRAFDAQKGAGGNIGDTIGGHRASLACRKDSNHAAPTRQGRTCVSRRASRPG